MGFGTLEQLIAKGRPSPITSALQGFQQGAGIIPGIKMAQLAPQLRQAQIQLALAQAKKAQAIAATGGIKLPPQVQLLNAFQQSAQQDPTSARTQALGAMVRKLMQSAKGVSVSTTPGGTQVQIGGAAPAAAPISTGAQNLISNQQVAAQPHPSHIEQTEQSLLFPPQATQAQTADQKQLGVDMKNVSTNAQLSTDKDLKFFNDLRQAAKEASKFVNPVTGNFAWASPAGTRLQQLLGRNAIRILSMSKGIRNQREFNKVVKGAGTIKMFPSTLMKIFNDGLDDAYQRRLKNDFYSNYVAKGGNSSSEASRLWASSLTHKGIANVPDKFLDFNVSGTNRNYKDYTRTIKKLIAKNPKSAGLSNLPLVSLIREDIGGEQ